MIRYAPARLAQPAPACPPVTKTEAAVVMSALTVFGAGAAWAGISTGLRERGVLSAVGWGVGIVGGFAGVFTLTCLIKLAAGTWQPRG